MSYASPCTSPTPASGTARRPATGCTPTLRSTAGSATGWENRIMVAPAGSETEEAWCRRAADAPAGWQAQVAAGVGQELRIAIDFADYVMAVSCTTVARSRPDLADMALTCKNMVSEGGLEPPCPKRALAPQASASAYSATRTCADHDRTCRPPHDSKTSRSAQVRWPVQRRARPPATAPGPASRAAPGHAAQTAPGRAGPPGRPGRATMAG
jgi:hypothetical protein